MKFKLIENYQFLSIEGTNANFTPHIREYETNDKKEIKILQSKEYLKGDLELPKIPKQTTLGEQ